MAVGEEKRRSDGLRPGFQGSRFAWPQGRQIRMSPIRRLFGRSPPCRITRNDDWMSTFPGLRDMTPMSALSEKNGEKGFARKRV